MSELKKIKGYIYYSGQDQWLNATLVLENGWAPFGHLCSHPLYMPHDLILRRKDRQETLAKMGYEIELVGEPQDQNNIPEDLLALNQDESNYKEMSELYNKTKIELFGEES